MLFSGSYVPDKAAHKFTGDIGTHESRCLLNAYPVGGIKMSSLSVTQDDTDNEGVVDGADVAVASTSITASGAVIYRSGGTDPEDCTLIQFVDFGSNQSSSNGTFQITWNSTEGILNIT